MEQALLDHLNNAAVSINAAFCDFNRVSIRDALIAAHGANPVVVTGSMNWSGAGANRDRSLLEFRQRHLEQQRRRRHA